MSLDCSANQLTSLPKLPETLTHLYCYNNQLTGLPRFPDSLVIIKYLLVKILPFQLKIDLKKQCWQNRAGSIFSMLLSILGALFG